jgi:hypothetical protein
MLGGVAFGLSTGQRRAGIHCSKSGGEAGFRDKAEGLSRHGDRAPAVGAILLHDAPSQRTNQGRYSAQASQQVLLGTVTGGTGSETGITCQVR